MVDPGPSSTYARLLEGLAGLGMAPEDIRHVLLTHIHLDHAGATGHLLEANPKIRVHVHGDGAPHLVDPERLIKSTRRTFGPRSETLWGTPVPVPSSAIQAWVPGDPCGLAWGRILPSPGHIDHHLAFQLDSDGTLVAGDAMGILLTPEGPVHPPTPPPSLDFLAWAETLEGWAGLDVPAFVATHFGLHRGFHARRLELLEALSCLEARVSQALADGRAGLEAARAYGAEVVARMSHHGDEARVRKYFATFPADHEWLGAVLHLRRRQKLAASD